jgi:hypothetical protein
LLNVLSIHWADLPIPSAFLICGGFNGAPGFNPRITVHLQHAKVYEVLNAIVAQNGKAIWTVTASPEKPSKLQSGGIWYIYPLQQPFEATALERLARVQR